MLKWLLVVLMSGAATAAPVKLFDEKPVRIVRDDSGIYIVDFGRVAFGNIELFPEAGKTGEVVTVHFGEDAVDGRVNRKPPGTVRYAAARVPLEEGSVVAAPPADKRNTRVDRNAVLTPEAWGVVMPFRWLEVEGWPGELRPEHITRRAAYLSSWNDDAAAFECSDEMLNRIWELCRYSIKATTFAGVYVDGDRERIPYEADAYLNQLSHYYTDNNIQTARDTFDYLMEYPTWPTEWASHMIFMAHAEWMNTGDTAWLQPRYEALKEKLLLERRGEDGLVVSDERDISRDDIVDWPKDERDGYVHTRQNTVVNAFFIRSLEWMSELALALGKTDDAETYAEMAEIARVQFRQLFFEAGKGLYRDGTDTDHISLHANLFPLAFGLVPEADRAGITAWLADRGMCCSVYAAQYLLEALFENGAGEAAVALMTAPGDRSWRHMVDSGATITWEAWDLKYKPNQDWNHAWGAAPANLLPRFVLGVKALEPGWALAQIRPCLSGLTFAKGRVPTPRGSIEVEWMLSERFEVSVTAPEGMPVRLELPAIGNTTGVFSGDRKINAERIGDRWVFEAVLPGKTTFFIR